MGREGNWVESTFAKASGTVTKDKEEIGQQLIGASPVTIPETIAGCILVPFPFPSLKWEEKETGTS